VLQHALLGRQAQVVVDEAEIDPGTHGDIDDGMLAHATRIHQSQPIPPYAFRSTAIGEVRAIRSVPTHPENATSAAAATINSSNGPTGGQ